MMVMSPKCLNFVFDIFLSEHYAPDGHSFQQLLVEVGLPRATSQMLHLKLIVIHSRIIVLYVDSINTFLCSFYALVTFY